MYRIFGYTMDCIDFDFTVDSFVEAIQQMKKLNRECSMVFLQRDKPGTCKYLNRFCLL